MVLTQNPGDQYCEMVTTKRRNKFWRRESSTMSTLPPTPDHSLLRDWTVRLFEEYGTTARCKKGLHRLAQRLFLWHLQLWLKLKNNKTNQPHGNVEFPELFSLILLIREVQGLWLSTWTGCTFKLRSFEGLLKSSSVIRKGSWNCSNKGSLTNKTQMETSVHSLIFFGNNYPCLGCILMADDYTLENKVACCWSPAT